MRYTQPLAVPLGAVAAAFALAACQSKPATAPSPTAAAASTSAAAAPATQTAAGAPGAAGRRGGGAADAGGAARAPRVNAAEAERLAKAREDSLDRIRFAAIRADSIADAANVAKAAAAAQAAMKEKLLAPVRFAPGSSSVDFDASAPLDHKVPILLTNPTVTLRITGHAYELSSPGANTALGLARADSAKHYIVIQGVAANRIQTAGHADQKPAGASDDSLLALRSDSFEITASPPMLRNL